MISTSSPQASRTSCAGSTNTAAKRDTIQVRPKAYPSIRELALARALGDQGIASSICPIHAEETAEGDPLFGHRPAARALADRIAGALK